MNEIKLNKEICKFCRSKRFRPFQSKDEVMWEQNRVDCRFGMEEIQSILKIIGIAPVFMDGFINTGDMKAFMDETTRWTNEPPPSYCPYITEHTVTSDDMNL